MYKYFILTLTVAILGSVAYGANCDDKQLKLCGAFCKANGPEGARGCSKRTCSTIINSGFNLSVSKCEDDLVEPCSLFVQSFPGGNCRCAKVGTDGQGRVAACKA